MNDEGRLPERPRQNHLRQPLTIAMQRLGTASLVADCWLREDPIWTEIRRHADADLEHYLSKDVDTRTLGQAA
jgi:hypothetical protein